MGVELLVVQNENALLRRQLKGPVWYAPADRLCFGALSALIAALVVACLPDDARNRVGMAPQTHRA
ncbi:hypothetical protein [Streptomyces sp. MUSC 14]|uniref:hypothetical protein n=1 Tax=Streptomyces sp. MUSC 14 TaxID=1354889 RepID=UPI0008F572EB|nr:hypothetical protein [Streptomyces sp. MUSC 14]